MPRSRLLVASPSPRLRQKERYVGSLDQVSIVLAPEPMRNAERARALRLEAGVKPGEESVSLRAQPPQKERAELLSPDASDNIRRTARLLEH